MSNCEGQMGATLMSNCEGQMGATLTCLIVRDKWEPL